MRTRKHIFIHPASSWDMHRVWERGEVFLIRPEAWPDREACPERKRSFRGGVGGVVGGGQKQNTLNNQEGHFIIHKKISFLTLKTSLSFLMCYVEIDMVRPIRNCRGPRTGHLVYNESVPFRIHLTLGPTTILSTPTCTPKVIPISWCFWSGNLITIWSDQKNRLGHCYWLFL